VLPDHLHTIWTLPGGDGDFAVRWRLIKASFSRGLRQTEGISASRLRKPERGVWQRRYGNTRCATKPISRGISIIFTSTRSNAAVWSARGPDCFRRSIAWCGSASTPRPGRTGPRISRAGSASGNGFRSAQSILRATSYELNAIKGLRHAEEGSGEAGARLEARTLSMRQDFARSLRFVCLRLL
jgi:hypothetical protein